MFNENIPDLSQNRLRLIDMRVVALRLAVLSAMLLALSSAATFAQSASGGSPVGLRQIEYIDPHEGGRHLALAVFYPAATRDRAAPPFVMPFFANLNLYRDAEPAFGGAKRPLVMRMDAAATAYTTPGSPRRLLRAATSWPRSIITAPTLMIRILHISRTSSGNVHATSASPSASSWTTHFGARRSTRIASASPAIHKVGSPRCGWEARGSIPKSTSPFNAAGATIRWCRNICAMSCRSMPRQRSTCTTNA